MSKKYKLLKPLPDVPVGTIFILSDEEDITESILYVPEKLWRPMFDQTTMDNPEWFEEVINLPKNINEIPKIEGFYLNRDDITIASDLFATRKQAESALAFAQLSQLAKILNDGWKPDWNDSLLKYAITCRKNRLVIAFYYNCNKHIVFKTEELAEFSLKHHKELWEKYWMMNK